MSEENALIQRLPVERDVDGWWSHPSYLSEHDDEITEAQFQQWCLRHQVETKITYMESDVPVDVLDAYMEDGQVDCSVWEIRLYLGSTRGSGTEVPRAAGDAMILPLLYMAWLIYSGPRP